jgi:hypothetical protein
MDRSLDLDLTTDIDAAAAAYMDRDLCDLTATLDLIFAVDAATGAVVEPQPPTPANPDAVFEYAVMDGERVLSVHQTYDNAFVAAHRFAMLQRENRRLMAELAREHYEGVHDG